MFCQYSESREKWRQRLEKTDSATMAVLSSAGNTSRSGVDTENDDNDEDDDAKADDTDEPDTEDAEEHDADATEEHDEDTTEEHDAEAHDGDETEDKDPDDPEDSDTAVTTGHTCVCALHVFQLIHRRCGRL